MLINYVHSTRNLDRQYKHVRAVDMDMTCAGHDWRARWKRSKTEWHTRPKKFGENRPMLIKRERLGVRFVHVFFTCRPGKCTKINLINVSQTFFVMWPPLISKLLWPPLSCRHISDKRKFISLCWNKIKLLYTYISRPLPTHKIHQQRLIECHGP